MSLKEKSFKFLVTEETKNQRLGYCEICENNKFGICAKCNCIVKAKIQFKPNKCPIGKWGPVPIE